MSLQRSRHGFLEYDGVIRPGDFVRVYDNEELVRVHHLITTPNHNHQEEGLEHAGDTVWFFGNRWSRAAVQPFPHKYHHVYTETDEIIGGLFSVIKGRALTWQPYWVATRAEQRVTRIYAPLLEKKN